MHSLGLSTLCLVFAFLTLGTSKGAHAWSLESVTSSVSSKGVDGDGDAPTASYSLYGIGFRKDKDEKSEEQRNSIVARYYDRQLTLEKEHLKDEILRRAAHAISFVNTGLLLRGGTLLGVAASLYALGSSMVAMKILDAVKHDVEDGRGVKAKAWISLFFSGAAYCFKSRSMELSGGVILFFVQFMLNV